LFFYLKSFLFLCPRIAAPLRSALVRQSANSPYRLISPARKENQNQTETKTELKPLLFVWQIGKVKVTHLA
jgi:hypothetical protein